MAWNKLAPILKTSGRPMVSASVVVNKDGSAKVSLVLSASIHEEYQERTKVDVSAGEGDDAGCLLIEFIPTGAFDIKAFGKGGGRIFVPPGEGVPTKPATNAPCVLGERTADSLIVKLPVAEWHREIASRTGAAERRAAAPAAPATSVAAPPGSKPPPKLDIVEYLTGKGVQVARLAGGRFQLNGETVGGGSVLRVVNEHRKSADLDPLALAQVW